MTKVRPAAALAFLAVCIAFAAPACGGDASDGEGAPATSAVACESRTRDYLDTLRALALKILYIEGAYVEYRSRVDRIRAARDAIAVEELSRGCRRRVIAVADRARDEYVSALAQWDEWRACEKERGGCNRSELDRALAGRWRSADYTRQQAEQNLYELLGEEERRDDYGATTTTTA